MHTSEFIKVILYVCTLTFRSVTPSIKPVSKIKTFVHSPSYPAKSLLYCLALVLRNWVVRGKQHKTPNSLSSGKSFYSELGVVVNALIPALRGTEAGETLGV